MSEAIPAACTAQLAHFLALMLAFLRLFAVVADWALLGSHIQPTAGTSKSLSTTGPSVDAGRLLLQLQSRLCRIAAADGVAAAVAALLLLE